MTSTIHADKIMNSSGDQDSGLDLLVNDQVKIKTANTDRVTVTDATTTVANDLAANTIKHTGGTTGLTINSSGVVSKPATPRLSVWLYTGMTIATATYTLVQLNGTDLISGGMTGFTHSNSYSRFTAATAGDYFVSASMRWYTNSGIAGSRLNINKNGSMVMESFSNSLAYYEQLHCSTIITLAANDYLELVVYQASGSNQSLAAGKYVNMKAFLVA